MSYKVTTVEELDALPVGAVVMDADGDLYRKRDAPEGDNSWIDLDATARYGTYRTESSNTVLWQSIPSRAFVLWVPGDTDE